MTGAILAAMAAPLIVMPTRANAGLASAVDSGSYGPVVTIVSPQYADVVKGASVSIDVSVQQRSNPVKALQMFVDDHMATPGWVPLKSLQSSKFNWDTTVFSNGPHKLTVRVSDSAGLIGQAEITVYVNNASQSQQQEASSPALKWLGIQNGQVLTGVVNLELQASANFGVKYIFVMLNSASDPDKKPALRSWMINQPPYVIPFDTTKVNDGAYVLDALAYDALSNQGEAPRLNIGIANNTINPTYIGSGSTPENSSTTSTNNTNTTTTASADLSSNASSPANTPSGNSENALGNSSNTTIPLTQTIPLVVPFQPAAPTLIPQQPRQGALNDNSGGGNYNDNNDNGNSLMVEVQSSAQVQSSVPETQPRVTDLPLRLASNDVPAQPEIPAVISNTPPVTTLARPSLFASTNEIPASPSLSLSNEQPLATIAETKLSLLPDTVKLQAQATKAAIPVREAKLPESGLNTAENDMRQSLPISTLINAHSPSAILSPSQFEQASSQRYFQVNDAVSMPQDKTHVAASADVKSVYVPVFPKVALNSSSVKTPDKSTFTAPVTGMTGANVLSRMAQATPGKHIASNLIANAQIGALPGYIAPKPVSALLEASSDEPLLTTSSISLANSRMAQATPGKHIASNLTANAQIGALPGYIAPKPVSVLPEASSNEPLFTTPSVSQANSRMAQATPGNHISLSLMANTQIGALPGYVAPQSVSSSHHVVSGAPLFTVSDIPIAASSRIASANISGRPWGYQHNAQNELGQSTKPQIAFLPKFNSKPEIGSIASITVSPISTKMQVSEMPQFWPAVYQVTKRERLSAIAERYGLPVEVLAKNNGLKNSAILAAGQKVKMPRNLQVTYNGKASHSDVSSLLVGTTSVAAFRFLFEQQGGKVSWDSVNQTVHAKNGDNEVTLTIGSDQAMINQKAVMMDMAAFLLSGRTMVPVRLFEKSLNAQVTWDPSTGRMFVAMAN